MKQIKLCKPEKVEITTYYKGVALEKLMFPCLCTFIVPPGNVREVGMLNCGYPDLKVMYTLHHAEPRADVNRIGFDDDLFELLLRYDIEFEAGEICYYDYNK